MKLYLSWGYLPIFFILFLYRLIYELHFFDGIKGDFILDIVWC